MDFNEIFGEDVGATFDKFFASLKEAFKEAFGPILELFGVDVETLFAEKQ